MDLPTKEKILAKTGRALMRRWGDPDVMFQGVEFDGAYWFRHPDVETVFKVTVEELPRDQWPDMLGDG